jgi:hypothetical protein
MIAGDKGCTMRNVKTNPLNAYRQSAFSFLAVQGTKAEALLSARGELKKQSHFDSVGERWRTTARASTRARD